VFRREQKLEQELGDLTENGSVLEKDLSSCNEKINELEGNNRGLKDNIKELDVLKADLEA